MRGEQPPAAGSGDAERVRFVGDEDRVTGGDNPRQFSYWRGVTEDGVDRLGQHQRPALAAARQCPGDGGDVVVRCDGHGRTGEPAGVDHRGVDMRVRDDERVGVGQRLDDGEVGVIAGRERQRGRETGERGHFPLEFGVD